MPRPRSATAAVLPPAGPAINPAIDPAPAAPPRPSFHVADKASAAFLFSIWWVVGVLVCVCVCVRER